MRVKIGTQSTVTVANDSNPAAMRNRFFTASTAADLEMKVAKEVAELVLLNLDGDDWRASMCDIAVGDSVITSRVTFINANMGSEEDTIPVESEPGSGVPGIWLVYYEGGTAKALEENFSNAMNRVQKFLEEPSVAQVSILQTGGAGGQKSQKIVGMMLVQANS